MKNIYVNFKRFDIPRELGGVNSIAPINDWAKYIVDNIENRLLDYKDNSNFTFFFPEMHLLSAIASKKYDGVFNIGSQSVHFEDVSKGGNFGAFTTDRPAAAVKSVGCTHVIIGHCEERNKLFKILNSTSTSSEAIAAVNSILNNQVKNAIDQGLKVLFCIGEKSEEVSDWDKVLLTQLSDGLKDVDLEKVVIAYEPVWSIGPGKTPADKEYITKVAKFIKSNFQNLKVVYGGGLKKENAKMLASIEEIDGGLIALTRFQGDIGFYPDEFIEIIDEYLK